MDAKGIGKTHTPRTKNDAMNSTNIVDGDAKIFVCGRFPLWKKRLQWSWTRGEEDGTV